LDWNGVFFLEDAAEKLEEVDVHQSIISKDACTDRQIDRACESFPNTE